MDLSNLEPNERIKKLAQYSDSIDVDPNVPPRRYKSSIKHALFIKKIISKLGITDQASKWFEWRTFISTKEAWKMPTYFT